MSSYIQSTHGASVGNGATLSLSGVGAGHTLVVFTDSFGGDKVTGVSDNNVGETFTQVGTTASEPDAYLKIWVATNVVGGSTTLTLASTGGGCDWIALEYLAATVDQFAKSSGGEVAGALATANTSATQSGDQVLVAAFVSEDGSISTWSAGAGYNPLRELFTGAYGVQTCGAEDLDVTSSGGVYAASFSNSGGSGTSIFSVAALVTLKLASPAPSSGSQPSVQTFWMG